MKRSSQLAKSPETVVRASGARAPLLDAHTATSGGVLHARVTVKGGGDSILNGDLGSPDANTPEWRERLLKALGTPSPNFAALALTDLISLIGGEEKCEVHINAALAIVEGLRPTNEAEALLAVQMVAAHLGAMTAFSYMTRAQQLPQFQVHGELANKFMRTYASHLETVTKLRRGGEQTVRVEHVHVYSGGQAVVGDVNVSRGEGAREINEQPHAPGSGASVSSPEVRCEDAVWHDLPRTRAKRKKKVPHARRQVARRAKGK